MRLYIGSPYDAQARYASKGATVLSGYKVHLTKSCDEGAPNLITNVETTHAAVSDDATTSTIHTALHARGLLSKTHIADTGFVNASLLVEARDRSDRSDAWRPTVAGSGWRRVGRTGLRRRLHLAADDISSREDDQSWTPMLTRGTTPVIKIKFSAADCRACSLQSLCTRSITARRAITIRPEAQHEALCVGRAREQIADFAVQYAWRAGVEGTIESRRACVRLGHVGQAKTHLAHLMTAAAMNLVRLLRWLSDEPRAKTRHGAITQLNELTS